MFYQRKRMSVFSLLTVLLSTLLIVSPALAAANMVVTPAHPDDWQPLNVRTDATVGITMAQPRGDAPNNLGSLAFTTNTITNGQDKADYGKYWGVISGRTLGNLSALSYEFYRASSSTTAQHFVPAFRLAYATIDVPPKTGYLIWENVYNGGSTSTPVPTDQWLSKDILAGNFWMRAFGSPSVTIDDYNVNLSEWQSNTDEEGSPIDDDSDSDVPHVLDANTNIIGIEIGVGSGWGGTFTGFVDNVVIGFGSDSMSANFEPNVCNICYADAVNGLDTNDGSSVAKAKKTIQAAIDAVQPNGQVRVLPGAYNETATHRYILANSQNSGPYQFGLFVSEYKAGITILGVTAADLPITDYNDVLAEVTTNATNNFGVSGIFVEGDNVTVQGLKILDNIVSGQPTNNKTFEILGDAFALKYSQIAVSDGGAVYFGDWRFNTTTNTSHIQSYTVEANLFDLGAQVALSNGAGVSGPLSSRMIKNNKFINANNWPSISFNGTGGVAWYEHPVGGAVITGNTFINTFTGNTATASHIRARGDYTNSQFDWASFWHDNTFNKAVVTLSGAPAAFNVRTYAYDTFTNVRRIGPLIQPEIDRAVNGDTVLVNQGTYAESPNLTKSLTLLGEDGRELTNILLQSGPTYLGALTVDAATVTIDGFTIVGFDGTPSTLASSNIVVTTNAKTVLIQNNRLKVGRIDGASSNDDDGIGLLTTYNTNNPPVDSVTVLNNEFAPLSTNGGTRAFYINPGVNNFTFKQNQITDKFDGRAITQAKQGLVEANTVTGNGTSAGLGVWGEPDPQIWGHTTFRNNTIFGVTTAISLIDAEGVNVEKNLLSGNLNAVKLSRSTDPVVAHLSDSATIHINRNNLATNSQIGIDNPLSGNPVDGTCNWWGDVTGPSINNPGTGVAVSPKVTFNPWIGSADLDGPCATPSVQFDVAASAVVENVGSAAIVVKLSEPAGQIITVAYTTNNGTATAGTDYTAQSATLTFNPGETSQIINVPINDDSLDEDDEAFNLTLTNPGHATLGALTNHNLTITDNDPPPVLQFSSANVGVNENAGAALIAVTLNTPSSHNVTFNYSTGDGTALTGSDYTGISGQLTIPAGQVSTSFVVPIVNDTVVEPVETINLQLTTPVNATLGTANATLTVIDDDSGPLVNFSNAGYTVNEGDNTATITATLSAPATTSVTVGYTTGNGTATGGSDYASTSGTLTFAPGVINQTFSVTINDDGVAENDETVALSLSAPSGATLGAPANAILTIVDNDTQPTVQFSNAIYNVNENGNTATITVNLSQVATISTTVHYATGNGTATAGSDYTATSGNVTFEPGQISQTFSVPITDDNVDESVETINLTLSNADNATLGTQATTTLNIIDNDGEPIIEGQSANVLVAENVSGGLATLTVTLSAVATQTVSVSYATSDVTAVAGNDYVASNGTLTFNPGQISQTFTVPILDDGLDEPNETVLIRYTMPSNASLGAVRDVILTIVDNDLPPTVEFSSATYSTAENAGTVLIVATLSAPSAFTVKVPYLISNGSATAGSDYTAANGSLTFVPGQTSQNFAIAILTDQLPENNETVNLALGTPINAALGAQQNAILTIADAGFTFEVNARVYLPLVLNTDQ